MMKKTKKQRRPYKKMGGGELDENKAQQSG